MLYLTYKRVKLIQASLVISTGSMGFTSGFLYGKILTNFQKNCLLYANVSIRLGSPKAEDDDNDNGLRTNVDVFVESKTTWGANHFCELVTFEGILVFMTSFTWLWFFLNMDLTSAMASEMNIGPLQLNQERHRGWSFYVRSCDRVEVRSRDALFVIPPIIINVVLCFLSIIRVSYATDGYQHFCFSLCQVPNGIPCHDATDACRQLQRHHWVFLSTQLAKPETFAFHDAMKAALVLSWLEPLMLASHVLVIMAHVYLEASTPPERLSGSATSPSPASKDSATDRTTTSPSMISGTSAENYNVNKVIPHTGYDSFFLPPRDEAEDFQFPSQPYRISIRPKVSPSAGVNDNAPHMAAVSDNDPPNTVWGSVLGKRRQKTRSLPACL